MVAIKIKILKYISDDQPGFVECSFFDAFNKEHIVQDKVPIVTEKFLDATGKYPQDGRIACKIVNEWIGSNGQKTVKITTSKPWDINSMEGLTEFDVLEEQLIEL